MQDERPAFDVTKSVRQVTGQFAGADANARSATRKRTSGFVADWCGHAAVVRTLVRRCNEVGLAVLLEPSALVLDPLSSPEPRPSTLYGKRHLVKHRFVPLTGGARAKDAQCVGGAYRAKRPGGM